MERAVDAFANWITKSLGPGSDFATVTFIGAEDIRSAMVLFAAVKCGYKLLLPSPRNTVDTNLDLMRQTQSSILLYASEMELLARELDAFTPDSFRNLEIPTLDWFLTTYEMPFSYQPPRPSALFVPPSLLEQLWSYPSPSALLQNLRFIVYIGGPLSAAIGDEISRTIHVRQLYGSTETLTIPLLEPEDPVADWRYLSFHPNARAVPELVPANLSGEDCELVLHPGPLAAVLGTVPRLKEEKEEKGYTAWRTKDLFRVHPNQKDLWLYVGRVDDVLVLSSGEKVQPVGMELAIVGGSEGILSGALVIGAGRGQVGLLLEVAEDADG
ncbi:male sterility protein [Paraphaeosphaeria sporulosa]